MKTRLLYILLLSPLSLFAQEFVNSNTFDAKVSKGIVVVEFWAEWNKSNEVPFLGELKDCVSYKLSIVGNSSIQKQFNVTSVPTLIILNNGIEEKRFNSNIMMQLNATKKDVQSTVDEITFNKFQ